MSAAEVNNTFNTEERSLETHVVGAVSYADNLAKHSRVHCTILVVRRSLVGGAPWKARKHWSLHLVTRRIRFVRGRVEALK